jgi:non-ribosomal peptide synthase protein (TIGR01720 family)
MMPEYMVPSSFIFLEGLPRTPSGKLDRNALPDASLPNTSTDSPFHSPSSPIQLALASVFASTLGLDRVSIDDNFFELGGDSILSIQIIARANRLGIHLSPRQIFLHQTIRQLAEVASAERIENHFTDNKAEGDLELTPIQRWFFDQRHTHTDHYNQAVVLSSLRPLNLHALRQAVCQLVEHHDSLRLRFPLQGQTRKQHYASADESDLLSNIDLTAIDPARRAAEIDRANNSAQASLDLQRGPIARVILHRSATDDHTMLIVIHHLAVDGVSWRILLEDLQEGYDQASAGQRIDLGPKTDSYKSWSERLRRFAGSAHMEKQKMWWQKQEARTSAKLPVDKERSENLMGSQRRVEVEMSVEQTAKIMKEVRRAYRVEVDEVLMSGVVKAVSEWSGNEVVRVEVEGHGREEIVGGDVSRSVGWFTSLYPVRMEVREGGSIEEVMKEVKEEMRRVPDRGVGYGVYRYLMRRDEEAEERVEEEVGEIGFNYLGQFDGVLGERSEWEMSERGGGRMSSRENRRGQLLEVNAMIVGGRLGVEISYSELVHEEETVRRLGERMREVIEEIIKMSEREGAGLYTPSDFPEANLSQIELDELIEDLEQLAKNN